MNHRTRTRYVGTVMLGWIVMAAILWGVIGLLGWLIVEVIR